MMGPLVRALLSEYWKEVLALAAVEIATFVAADVAAQEINKAIKRKRKAEALAGRKRAPSGQTGKGRSRSKASVRKARVDAKATADQSEQTS